MPFAPTVRVMLMVVVVDVLDWAVDVVRVMDVVGALDVVEVVDVVRVVDVVKVVDRDVVVLVIDDDGDDEDEDEDVADKVVVERGLLDVDEDVAVDGEVVDVVDGAETVPMTQYFWPATSVVGQLTLGFSA